jgi:hypothetical protein
LSFVSVEKSADSMPKMPSPGQDAGMVTPHLSEAEHTGAKHRSAPRARDVVDGVDDELADLDGELGHLRLVEMLEIGRTLDAVQQRCG